MQNDEKRRAYHIFVLRGQIPKSCLQANSTIPGIRDLMRLVADLRESLL